MATLSARPASRFWSTRTLALYHSGVWIMARSHLSLGCAPDDYGFGLRVIVQRLYAVLLAVSGLFPTPERQLVVDDLGGVDPGVPGFDVLGGLGGPVEVSGPDGEPQPVDGTVRQLQRLLHAPDPPDGQRRPEDLLRRHPRVVRRLQKQCRLVEVPLLRDPVALGPPRAVLHLGPRFHGALDLLLDKLPPTGGVERPEHNSLGGAWSHPQAADLRGQLLDELVGHALEDEDPLHREARLPGVEEPAHARGARRPIEVRVVADDHGVRAPKLERRALEVASRERHELLADRRGAGKGYLSHQGMLRERLARARPRPRHDVEHATWKAGLVHDLRDPQGGQRSGIRRLRDDDIPRN